MFKEVLTLCELLEIGSIFISRQNARLRNFSYKLKGIVPMERKSCQDQ